MYDKKFDSQRECESYIERECKLKMENNLGKYHAKLTMQIGQGQSDHNVENNCIGH